MAEYKQYITHIQEGGNVMVSEDVITTIVEHTMSEVEGVAGFSNKPGVDIADLIGKNWGKATKIQIAEDNTVSIICNIVVKYGFSVVDVARNAQQAVTSAVESMSGVKVSCIDVNVCGIVRQ